MNASRMQGLIVAGALVASAIVGVTSAAAPTPAAAAECTTSRLSGAGRVETAVAISADARDTADTVILARADAYPDALAAVPLAANLDAPLLLTDSAGLSKPTANEIKRLGATTAIVLGGETAISKRVARDLAALDVEVDRIGGDSRFATAALVAARLPDRTGRAVIVEGRNAEARRGWPDAVVAGPLAAERGDAVLMVDATAVPAETRKALVDLKIDRITIIGGPVSVSPQVLAELEDPNGDGKVDRTIERVSGPNRYVTSTEVAWEQVRDAGAPATLWLATGRSFPDALAAGAAAAASGGSLVLIDGTRSLVDEAARDFRRDLRGSLDRVVVAGGESAVGALAMREITDQFCSGKVPARDLNGDGLKCRPGGLANHARVVPSKALADAHGALTNNPSRAAALDLFRAAGPLMRHMVTEPSLLQDVEEWLDRTSEQSIGVAYHESEHAWQQLGGSLRFPLLQSCLALSGDLQGFLASDLSAAPPPRVIGEKLRTRVHQLFDDVSFERSAVDSFIDTYLTECADGGFCSSSNERVSSLFGEAHSYVSGYEYEWALVNSGAVPEPRPPGTGSRSVSLDGGYAVLPGLAMYLGELRRNHPDAWTEMVTVNGDAIAEIWRILEFNYPGPFAADDGRFWQLFFGDGNAREIALATNFRAGVDLPPRPKP